MRKFPRMLAALVPFMLATCNKSTQDSSTGFLPEDFVNDAIVLRVIPFDALKKKIQKTLALGDSSQLTVYLDGQKEVLSKDINPSGIRALSKAADIGCAESIKTLADLEGMLAVWAGPGDHSAVAGAIRAEVGKRSELTTEAQKDHAGCMAVLIGYPGYLNL